MSDPSKHRAPTPRASGSLVRRLVPATIAVALLAGGVTAAGLTDPFADDGGTDQPRRTAALSISSAMSDVLPEDLPQPVVEGSTLRLTKARKAELARLEAQRRARLKAERLAAKRAAQPFSFQVASFNVLGSNHTGPGGERRSFPTAGTRTPQAVGVLRSHGTDVIGLQEAKRDQLTTIQSTGMRAGGRHPPEVLPPTAATKPVGGRKRQKNAARSFMSPVTSTGRPLSRRALTSATPRFQPATRVEVLRAS